LSGDYLTSLKSHGVNWIYIEDPSTDDIVVRDLIFEGTRVSANALMAEILSSNPPNLNREHLLSVKGIARDIISEVKEYRPKVTYELWNLKTIQDYLYLHSVNVAVLSALIGWRMNLNNQELEDLTMGVLLHDIGKVTISEAIHNKPGRLTEEEFAEMRQHTVRGFNFMRDKGAYSPIMWAVAHQHHELYDGSGYPQQRKGKEIHLFSRIATVADIFDALTSDRPYKSGWAFHKVLDYLENGMRRKLDPLTRKSFVDLIPVYPVGMPVKLSTGEVGLVLESADMNYHRPKVRVIIDAKGRALTVSECYDVDLSKASEIKIVK
jgi:HD-GYP domain-containing protein (c-di-GMP phosphodiesterase class II)